MESEEHSRMSDVPEENDVRAKPDDFIIDTTLSHKINRSRCHSHAKLVKDLYRFRWNGYLPSEETWEPIVNMTRRHVLNFHNTKRLNMLENLIATRDDRKTNIEETPNSMVE